MAGMGYAVMGTSSASGDRRTIEAAQRAIASPLLEAGAIDGARGILINITGSSSLKLAEVQQACTIIQNAAHDDANIIFGAVQDEKMKDGVKITVIATGFRDSARIHRSHGESFISSGSGRREPIDLSEPEPDFEPEPPTPPLVMQEQIMQAGPATAEVPLEAPARQSAPNFEAHDLDVPAFLRKRTDVM
jgi:cell division protein FtsZ